jgi:hypothetical protein
VLYVSTAVLSESVGRSGTVGFTEGVQVAKTHHTISSAGALKKGPQSVSDEHAMLAKVVVETKAKLSEMEEEIKVDDIAKTALKAELVKAKEQNFALQEEMATMTAGESVRYKRLQVECDTLRIEAATVKEELDKRMTHEQALSSPVSTLAFQHPPIIMGHIHMAKTGGTSVNGMIANKFERVCGHKGYSYDAYQANERFKKLDNTRLTQFGRDRVMPSTMSEIGWEDCDWISHETGHKFWFQFDDFHDTPMELHLPCRDPIDHLMSQCNYKGKKLSCNGTDEELIESVESCFAFLHRFSMELTNRTKTTLKCYDFRQQFTTYMDYVSEKLQPRRFVSENYKQRETNKKRNKKNECIWNHHSLMARVESYLISNVEYYNFCKQCLGSADDITRLDKQ